MAPASLATLNDEVWLQWTNDEIVLVDFRDHLFYGLDEVGARMLDLARSLPTADAVVARLLDEYDDVTAEALRADLARLLDDLAVRGLVHRV